MILGAVIGGVVGDRIDVGGSRSFFLVVALAMTGTLLGLAFIQRHVPRN
jgi:uncharacterized protein YcfJ